MFRLFPNISNEDLVKLWAKRKAFLDQHVLNKIYSQLLSLLFLGFIGSVITSLDHKLKFPASLFFVFVVVISFLAIFCDRRSSNLFTPDIDSNRNDYSILMIWNNIFVLCLSVFFFIMSISSYFNSGIFHSEIKVFLVFSTLALVGYTILGVMTMISWEIHSLHEKKGWTSGDYRIFVGIISLTGILLKIAVAVIPEEFNWIKFLIPVVCFSIVGVYCLAKGVYQVVLDIYLMGRITLD